MGLLTSEQRKELRDYLEKHGLTFESLQTEMLDHICCDVEMYMTQGLAFEKALEKVKSEIPKNQLKKIQTETMEVLNKRISLTNILKYISFSLLLAATLFKILHLPGAGQLLLSSFVGLALTLFSGLFTSPLIREKERGRGALLALIVSITVFLTSLCFQLLHLPGTAFLRMTSVILLILILSTYAIYCYLHPDRASNHIIIEYLKKDGFNIEKTLIILFIFGTSLKFWQNDFLFVVFFMLLFSYGSIFYFVKSWQYYFRKEVKSNEKLLLLFVSIIAYAAFVLPTIRLIEAPARIIMTWGTFSLVSLAIAIYYFFNSEDNQKLILGFFSFLVSVLAMINLIAKAIVVSPTDSQYLLGFAYSPVVFTILLALFVIFFKKPLFRALLLMTLGIFVFSYQLPGI
ncbi:hypothetical protein QQ008_22325 [Fulvivirgaceae bacterium BMA10]|uniref:DUF2157 domain-containing protein n=1 Tax=Splendidivirga corallicola TaxID=3051826 RepID=A0ABT8KTS7_9BACT|nr:hypothetical protein [Fulvivirgaceae bacterium BMA10]